MNEDLNTKQYRKLPSVDELLRIAEKCNELLSASRSLMVECIRRILISAREQISKGAESPTIEALIQALVVEVNSIGRLSQRSVVNASGIVIHTGLGRSVLSSVACAQILESACRHSSLELDLETNMRSSRQDHVRGLLARLTGAGDAFVINNNAAAVFLAVNTLAFGKNVIISRGQLIEIGGSFRLPDIIERAGGNLVEIGTTNRTRISDFENAITSDTGLIIRCHPSNFKISGYTQEAQINELVNLSANTGIPLLDDLGSGALVDISACGLAYEPTVQDSIKSGVDLVCFSGDKLMGSCQCGIIAGKSDMVGKLKVNPIARALRVDKLTLAFLEATLREYAWGEPFESIPVLRFLSRSVDQIFAQVERARIILNSAGLEYIDAQIMEVVSEVGGGAVPGQELKSIALTLKSSSVSTEYITGRLRTGSPSILGRAHKDVCILDFRTVFDDETTVITDRILELDALIGENGGEL